MAKTRQEWDALSRWTREETFARMGQLRLDLERGILESELSFPLEDDFLADLIDETIVLLLQILRTVVQEKRWTPTRPLNLFEAAYQDFPENVWQLILIRFRDTKSYAERYLNGDAKTKAMLKPKLISRGFI